MIARMKKFHLFFTGDEEKLLKKLQKEEIVEIEGLRKEFGFENFKSTSTSIVEKINKLDFLKGIVKKVEGKEFGGKILLTEKQEQKVISTFSIEENYKKFKELNDEIERRKTIDKKIDNIISQLEPIKNIRIDFSILFSLKNFSFFLFTVKKEFSIKIDNVFVEKVYRDKKETFYLTIFSREERENIIQKIKENGGKIVEVKRWNGYPIKIIDKLLKTKKKNQQKIANYEKKLKEIEKIKREIFVVYDYYLSLLDYFKTKEKLVSSKFIKGFCGWIKEKDIERLNNFVKENIPEGFLHFSEPEENENVPISLENHPLIKPFEVVTDLYGRPVYKNLDPTSPLSLFFAISFGFCLTDAGYGILLIFLSLILMRKFKLYPTLYKFLKLLLYCGVGTLIMGTITGGWFGDIIFRFSESSPVTKFFNSFIILNPLKGGNSAFVFLAWALVLGYIQIIWGLILNLYNSIKYSTFSDILIAISTLLIQILIGVVALLFFRGIKTGVVFYIPVFLIVLCFLTIMVINSISQKGLMMKAFWAFYSIYTIVASNLLGDVLSYSRLFGLGLTTAVLALVVNQIVFMAKGIPFIGIPIAAVIFLIGHFGNLAINLLGGYVHTSRLQYLEFFTKFYKSGGRPFTPFSERRVYTYLEKF